MIPIPGKASDAFALAALCCAFVLALVYQHAGTNVLFLTLSSGSLLLALVVMGPQRLAATVRANPLAAALGAYWIGAVIVLELFVTIRPATSLPVSWVLASVPLWFLAATALSNRSALHLVLLTLVVSLAAVSVTRYFWLGERASLPFADPNNYACLLYAAWIPLTHRLLTRSWAGRAAPPLLLLGHGACLLLLLALFATASRVGVLVVVAALCGWLALTLRGRRSFAPLAQTLLVVLLAAGLFALGNAGTAAAKLQGAGLGGGLEVRAALFDGALAALAGEGAWLTGTGLGTFEILYPSYRLPADVVTAGTFAHNDYLQLLLESGPWLLAPLLLVAAAVLRVALRALREPERSDSFGYAMAAGALLAHALVNFVFYMLPLAITFALLCAALFARQTVPAVMEASRRGRAVAVLAALLALVSWGALLPDLAIRAVFGGQPALGLASVVSSDGRALLGTARALQRLEPRRGEPHLVEALLLTNLLNQDPSSLGALREQALASYRRALARDPYNPVAYVSLYDFLRRHPDAASARALSPTEVPEALLRRAVELDVRQVSSLRRLLDYYDAMGQSQTALDMLKTDIVPWMPLVHRTSPPAAAAVLGEMKRRADVHEDAAFARELESLELTLSAIPIEDRSKGWMPGWLAPG